jgi:peroxiredoxin Q/BCP
MNVGDTAPDFELDGTDGKFRLSDYQGRPVVLLFYPGDETPVCTKQFCSYRDRTDELKALGAVVVGISSQTVDSHERFVKKHDLTVPLLADEGRRVAKRYGVTAPFLGVRRAVFVIDPEGRVAAKHVHALGLSFWSVDDIREALEKVVAAPSAG